MLRVEERHAVKKKRTDPLDVLPVVTQSVLMRDGVRLDADIYRPAEGGPYPVLLQRQAYGRRIGCTICYAHPSWYAAQGYIVVVQDIRGRGTSDGEFKVGECEASDGVDTIAWAAKLDGSTGAVGMYGFSYQGYNQLLAATAAGPALKALAPAMAPWHAFENWAFENGALRMQGAMGWAVQISAETARRAGDSTGYAELLALARALHFNSEIEARPVIMEKYRAYSHYMRWLDTPSEADYWKAISPATFARQIAERRLPMLFTGGWYDTHLASTWRAYSELLALSNPNLHLSIGPWLHFPWSHKAGAVDFGPDAAFDMNRLHIGFFNRYLKGEPDPFETVPPVRLFDMGSKTWRGYRNLSDKPKIFFLDGDGRVTNDICAGRLVDDPHVKPSHTEFIVHDPWRPAPSVGGAFGSPPGPVDRMQVDLRGDVATFTTPPMRASLTLAGAVQASLYVTSDTPEFDVNCVLSRVTTSGQSIPLCDGHIRVVRGGADAPVVVPMRATCITLARGEALRLSIAGASFPAFPVNPCNGSDPTRATRAEALITTLAISCGGARSSFLEVTLPDDTSIHPSPGEN